MSKFSLATNFDPGLIEKLAALNHRYDSTGNKVVEIFGALPSPFGVNSGRSALTLPQIDLSDLSRHVRQARSAGLSFNYVLNEICLGPLLSDDKGINKMLRFLDRLADLKIEVITVSNPMLANLLKKHRYRFKVNVSVISEVDSVSKAAEWVRMGAGRITLKNASRDFELISKIKAATGSEIEVIANTACREYSTYCFHHYVNDSLLQSRALPTYYRLRCAIAAMEDPVDHLIRNGSWIRPEDLVRYDRAGVDIYKILDRICPTDQLLFRAEAYLSGKYAGNLLDLLQAPGVSVYCLDNGKLDGFIEHFIANKCVRDCGRCDYCDRMAKKALRTIKPAKIKRDLREFRDLLSKCTFP